LGEHVLVAPVIQPGQRARDVYLPRGEWRDAHTGRIFTGPTVLTNEPAPLDTLLMYNRI